MKDFKSEKNCPTLNKSKEKLIQIINSAEDKDIELYLALIQDIQKYLKISPR